MLTFNEIIESFSRIVPSKTVVKDENRKLTYKELQINGEHLSVFNKLLIVDPTSSAIYIIVNIKKNND